MIFNAIKQKTKTLKIKKANEGKNCKSRYFNILLVFDDKSDEYDSKVVTAKRDIFNMLNVKKEEKSTHHTHNFYTILNVEKPSRLEAEREKMRTHREKVLYIDHCN